MSTKTDLISIFFKTNTGLQRHENDKIMSELLILGELTLKECLDVFTGKQNKNTE